MLQQQTAACQMGPPVWVLQASELNNIPMWLQAGTRAPFSHRQGPTDASKRTEGVSSWASASA